MFGALWRFVVYRLLGGRVLLVLTVLAWLRGVFARRRLVQRRPAYPPARVAYPPPPAAPPPPANSTLSDAP
jgi:hypothetical protein